MSIAGKKRKYDGRYSGGNLARVALPLGGIGAGMVSLEGSGTLAQVSVRNNPDVAGESRMFAAFCVKGRKKFARVLEGPVPEWRIFACKNSGNGFTGGPHFGLPRFQDASFEGRFPFGTVRLSDADSPLEVEVTGWSPFIPGDADSSGMPVAAVEYTFINASARAVDGVFSFHAFNFMAIAPEKGQPRGDSVRKSGHGFVLNQEAYEGKPWVKGAFGVSTDHVDAKVDVAWFRGGWFDPLTMVWNAIEAGKVLDQGEITEGEASPGGSIYVPVKVGAGKRKTVRVLLSWYVPETDYRLGEDEPGAMVAKENHRPWYAGKFADVGAVTREWLATYDALRAKTEVFSDCFFDTTLPGEALEAVANNLAILKSPTVLRDTAGRMWAWEGCFDQAGCCHGTCTHVWNYAQAVPHLFPELERSLRETEFGPSQDDRGHQNFRAFLPIRQADHGFHSAADGQLGGIIKVYREWRISGDTEWLKALWPKVKKSLQHCIESWDPRGKGLVEEPHHNTYDIEFWGADGMCTSFYLGALRAAVEMGKALGDDVAWYEQLLARGKANMETELWNGSYFYQKVQWEGLNAGNPVTAKNWNIGYSPEAIAIFQREGPKYQYGTGCLSDGVLGDWMARVSGVPVVLDEKKVARHVASIFTHNFRETLKGHANPQRPGYALGEESGLLLCSWPKGKKPALPFVYSDEVWTGIEYHVAGHLMMTGREKDGLRIVRAVRDRYDGRVRNPYNEYECGYWYARAMSSYGLIQAYSGVRYDAVDRTLHVESARKNFRSFLCTATGFGTVICKNGKVTLEVRAGTIAVDRVMVNGRGID